MNRSNATPPENDIFLEQNCRPDWPRWTCIFANVCGLTSTTLWFLVLLPQVWKNFRRKSVMGLSVLWATANFTASLINLFFVFIYVEIPIYGMINSVYCPILEFTLLIQFWVYGHQYGRKAKIGYLCGCLVVWTTVILLQLLLRIFEELQWVAIALWCVETFPQVILNMKLQSTSGQANKSVFIAMCGKTTDFLANYILVLPIQYVVMVYFSSSVAYLNGIQVAWYRPDNNQSGGQHRESSPATTEPVQYGDTKSQIVQENIRDCKERLRQLFVLRNSIISMGIILLSLLLIILVVGFVWNTGSYLGLLGPTGIVLVMAVSYGYLEIIRSREIDMSNLLLA